MESTKDAFVIVEYKINGAKEIEAVPSAWIINNRVYWPPTNIKDLIKLPWLAPDTKTWISNACKIKRVFDSFEEASEELTQMLKNSTTDDSEIEEEVKRRQLRSRKNFPSYQNTMKSLNIPNFIVPQVNISCKKCIISFHIINRK